MKLTTMIFTGTALSMAVSTALADRVHGSAKANFRTDELSIPCVMIEEHSELNDGSFYDIVLERRGKSFNYALSHAEPEDPVLCQRIADLAEYEEDDEMQEPDILVQCEIDVDRNRIKINGKELEEGDYYASVYSGGSVVDSLTMTSIEDEVEFRFDSNEDAIMNGAEPIETDFIVDGEITAEIWMADAVEPTLTSDPIVCLVD